MDEEKNTGSVYQRKDGYWIGAVSVTSDTGQRKRRTVGASTPEAARAKLDALIGGTRLPATANELRTIRRYAWAEGNASTDTENPYR